MNEKMAEKIFYKNLHDVCELMDNNGVTTDTQLRKYGKKVLGPFFTGVYSQDTIPKKNKANTCFITNVDTNDMPGSHWVAIYFSGKIYHIYDSFGRSSNSLLPIFTKRIKNSRFRFKDSDKDAEQRDSDHFCGQACIAYLLCIQQIGIKASMKI